MSRREEFIGIRTIKAANLYGEGQHLYTMWLDTSEPIVRCRDCTNIGDDERVFGDEWMPVKICNRMHDEQGECLIVEPNDFCAWGEK